MKLTADTITDDQVLQLRYDIENLTATALSEDGLTPNHLLVRKARARCAEILNARAEETETVGEPATAEQKANWREKAKAAK